MKYLTLTLLLCLLSPSLIASKSVPLTGSYSVGTKSHFIIDKSRDETLTKAKDDFRRISIQLFYPSNQVDKCADKLQSPYGKKVKCFNCQDADIFTAEKKYPIVILSPGFGGSFLMNMTLAEQLASEGYYVINVGHSFFNSTPTFPDGKRIELMSMDTLKLDSDNFEEEEFKTKLNTYIKIQKDDITSVLNELGNTLDSSHMNLIDLQNIACIGYSGGGATSAEACVADSRIKAGVNINGVLYGDAWKDTIQQPFLYINADYSNPKKAEIQMLGGRDAIDRLMTLYNERKNKLSSKSTNDFYELTIFNTTHHNFSDWALFDQSFCGKTNPKKCLENNYLFIRLFLDKYLKHQNPKTLDSNIRTKDYYFEVIKTAMRKR